LPLFNRQGCSKEKGTVLPPTLSNYGSDPSYGIDHIVFIRPYFRAMVPAVLLFFPLVPKSSLVFLGRNSFVLRTYFLFFIYAYVFHRPPIQFCEHLNWRKSPLFTSSPILVDKRFSQVPCYELSFPLFLFIVLLNFA